MEIAEKVGTTLATPASADSAVKGKSRFANRRRSFKKKFEPTFFAVINILAIIFARATLARIANKSGKIITENDNMTKQETRKNQELQGIALQEAVKQKLNNGLQQAVDMELPEMVAYVNALQNHFSDLSSVVDWTKPRTESEIKTIVGGTVGSTHLAYAKTGRDFESLYGLSNEEEWWSVIRGILENQDTKRIFMENMWRSPMVVVPSRGVPLQYLLRFHFEDRPICGVDLGAGLHFALPLLNSATYLDPEFPRKDKITRYAKPVNVVIGLGIDKQDRQSSLDWAKACYWPLRENLGGANRLENLHREVLVRSDQFPFLVADVLDQNDCVRRVGEIVNQGGQVDFVFSSFIRHQLGRDVLVQSNFKALVSNLLREDGIWVDLGEELITEEQYKTSGVRVFKKENGGVNLTGTPFVLSDQKDIQQIDLKYFGAL
ncbi:hypothetical protein KKB40_02210 [Patescibacteria group bacterium]|nr:hypothetical protein [Patescibacteria group bacterium]